MRLYMNDYVAGGIYVALDSSDIHAQWQGVDTDGCAWMSLSDGANVLISVGVVHRVDVVRSVGVIQVASVGRVLNIRRQGV
jgi:hypothetical protein